MRSFGDIDVLCWPHTQQSSMFDVCATVVICVHKMKSPTRATCIPRDNYVFHDTCAFKVFAISPQCKTESSLVIVRSGIHEGVVSTVLVTWSAQERRGRELAYLYCYRLCSICIVPGKRGQRRRRKRRSKSLVQAA